MEERKIDRWRREWQIDGCRWIKKDRQMDKKKIDRWINGGENDR